VIKVCSNGDRLRGSHPGDDPERRLALVRGWTVKPDFVSLNAALDEAGIAAPRLHHGEDLATWAVIDAALERGRDVRIGLEDTLVMADGSPAPSNAALVAEVARRAGAS